MLASRLTARQVVLAVGLFASCSVHAAIVLPFHLVDNRVVLATYVNGRGPFDFVLDTGAGSGAAVTPQVFKAAGLRAVRSGTDTGAGEDVQTTVQSVARELRIGPVVLHDVSISGIDIKAASDAIGFRRLDGILGDDLFKRFVVTLDFGSSQATLAEPATFAALPRDIVLPFEIYKDTIPVVEGSIDGHAGRFWIDLGDRWTLTLLAPFWQLHKMAEETPPPVEALTGYGIGGPIQGLVRRVRLLKLGNFTVDRTLARLSLQKKGWFADPDIAGSVGAGILRQYIVVIDYSRHQIVLRNGAKPYRDAPYDRAGIWVGNRAGVPTVLGVTAKGPGEEAGLSVGDRVLAIDGVPLSKNDVLPLRAKLEDARRTEVLVRVGRGKETFVRRVVLRDQV